MTYYTHKQWILGQGSHSQPGYCFCCLFSLGHSEEVCLQRKEKSPSVTIRTSCWLPLLPTQVSEWGWTLSHKQVFSKLTSSPVSAQCLREKLTSNGLTYLPNQTCSQDYKRSITMATHIYQCDSWRGFTSRNVLYWCNVVLYAMSMYVIRYFLETC